MPRCWWSASGRGDAGGLVGEEVGPVDPEDVGATLLGIHVGQDGVVGLGEGDGGARDAHVTAAAAGGEGQGGDGEKGDEKALHERVLVEGATSKGTA